MPWLEKHQIPDMNFFISMMMDRWSLYVIINGNLSSQSKEHMAWMYGRILLFPCVCPSSSTCAQIHLSLLTIKRWDMINGEQKDSSCSYRPCNTLEASSLRLKSSP